MVVRIDLRVDGDTAVARALHALGADVEHPDRGLDQIAADAATAVADQAPRLTGRLAGSVTGSATRDRAVVTVTAPYAGVINYGWAEHNISPAGYLQRADEQMQPIALRHLEHDIDRAIRKQGLTT
jgi:hypothetical protein